MQQMEKLKPPKQRADKFEIRRPASSSSQVPPPLISDNVVHLLRCATCAVSEQSINRNQPCGDHPDPDQKLVPWQY